LTSTSPSASRSVSPKPERLLLLVFVLSLPLLNPWVRGDGVGYYAFARAPLIEHSLDFTHDYQHANESFRENRLDPSGNPYSEFRTVTGHLDNHFTVGPAILWSPFLLLAHLGVLLARALGAHVAADGFSAPYRLAMAFGTAVYGFLGLLISFRLARKYLDERWAFLATLGIWWASSLPVYMYFNPSWSHAHSAFAVALFVWYWHRTRDSRTLRQWIVLGLIAGLMLDVYYANAMVFLVLVYEALTGYAASFRRVTPSTPRVSQLFVWHCSFVVALLVCLIPTFLSKWIVYGSPFSSGYVSLDHWYWTSPYLFQVLFSANHGLLSWTPILTLSALGVFLFWRAVPRAGAAFILAVLAFYFLIAAYPDWAGISSYGNRFFISLTAFFILGLAVFFSRAARLFASPNRAFVAASVMTLCFVLWNFGLMFQWGAHFIPARGPISFSEMARNQFTVVPRDITAQLRRYLFRRRSMMDQIERRDIEQLKQNPPPP
jgi:hypothetical protein